MKKRDLYAPGQWKPFDKDYWFNVHAPLNPFSSYVACPICKNYDNMEQRQYFEPERPYRVYEFRCTKCGSEWEHREVMD